MSSPKRVHDESPAYLAPSQGFAKRLARSMAVLAFREGVSSIGQEDLAGRVSKRLPNRKPYTQTAVSKWIGGKAVPDVDTVGIIAAVCGVRAAWLAYEDGPMTADDSGMPAPPEDMKAEGRPSAQRRARHA